MIAPLLHVLYDVLLSPLNSCQMSPLLRSAPTQKAPRFLASLWWGYHLRRSPLTRHAFDYLAQPCDMVLKNVVAGL